MSRILVIDDECNWLDLCTEALTGLGHEVHAASSCLDALEELKADPPDLAILDLRMPVSGRTMLQALREDWPDVPVIIHTVYDGYRHDPELARAGDFVAKSPDMTELVAAVGRVLGRQSVSVEKDQA